MHANTQFFALRTAVLPGAMRGLVFVLVTLLGDAAVAATMTIDIKNVARAQGTLHVEIMNKAAYKTSAHETARPDATVYTKLFPMTMPTMQVVVADVPAGRYAVRVYQDLDDDSRLDTNYLGRPAEPYGYANDVHSWFGKPSFGNASVVVAEASAHLAIRLRH